MLSFYWILLVKKIIKLVLFLFQQNTTICKLSYDGDKTKKLIWKYFIKLLGLTSIKYIESDKLLAAFTASFVNERKEIYYLFLSFITKTSLSIDMIY